MESIIKFLQTLGQELRSRTYALRKLTAPDTCIGGTCSRLYFLPAIGLLLGIMVFVVAWLTYKLCHWPIGVGIVLLLFLIWHHGGIQANGLAKLLTARTTDTSNNQTPAADKNFVTDHLPILILVLLVVIKITALAQIVAIGQGRWLLLPFMLAHMVMALLRCYLPTAQQADRTGKNYAVGGVAAVTLPALIVCLLLGGKTGVLLFLCALGLSWGLLYHFRAIANRDNSDLKLAAYEGVETVLLFLAAAWAH